MFLYCPSDKHQAEKDEGTLKGAKSRKRRKKVSVIRHNSALIPESNPGKGEATFDVYGH